MESGSGVVCKVWKLHSYYFTDKGYHFLKRYNNIIMLKSIINNYSKMYYGQLYNVLFIAFLEFIKQFYYIVIIIWKWFLRNQHNPIKLTTNKIN